MPFVIKKVGASYQVVNSKTGRVHAKHTTKLKAQAQLRLLKSLGY